MNNAELYEQEPQDSCINGLLFVLMAGRSCQTRRPNQIHQVELRTTPAIFYPKEEYMFPKYLVRNQPNAIDEAKVSVASATTNEVKTETSENHLEDYFADSLDDVDDGKICPLLGFLLHLRLLEYS